MSAPKHKWRWAGYAAGRDLHECTLCKAEWLEGEKEPPVCGRVTAKRVSTHPVPPRNTATTTTA